MSKRIIVLFVTVFLTFTIFAVPVFAIEDDTPSSDDSFLCALPSDGQFWTLCSDVDVNYARGTDYSWMIGERLFHFDFTADCKLIFFHPSSGFQSSTVIDLNNGGSDPPDVASIVITKAIVEENATGSLYDKLWLNFEVHDSAGNIVWPTSTSSPAFVSCLEARNFVKLPSNDILLHIAAFMPQSSPNIFNYIRGSTFTNGYNRGYTVGQKEGYNIARDELVPAARNDGYNEGYSAALAASDSFSFRGLVGAVIFAPINAFLQIFEFDFLGYNMRVFAASLITLAVVLAIVIIIIKIAGKFV